MTSTSHTRPVPLGDLIAAAHEAAGIITSDPRVAALIAARSVTRRLARMQRFDLIRALGASARIPYGRQPRTAVEARAA
jgi:hypothetical protein